jgi:putative transcriptional regulator
VDQTGLSSSFLIAMPQLQDPNFCRTVLLMVHHDETSSFALVLNRSTDLAISSLFESLEFEWRGDDDDPVSWGGPVELNSGWMLFGEIDRLALIEDEEDITPVVRGLNFAGSMDVFRHVAADPPRQLRFFLGYAGWGPGQLEFEIAQGAWLSAEASAETVFRVPAEAMWDHVVRGLGVDPSTLVSTSGVH